MSKTYKRVSEKKRNKQKDSLYKASHLISRKLVGDLSQRQMVMKQHQERNKQLNRQVFNDWGLYTFMQMLIYKCQKNGKDLAIIDERNTSKMCSGCGNLQPMPLYKRTYCCTECGMVMERDENSSVNILCRYMTPLALVELSRYLAGLRPHTSALQGCGVLHDVRREVGIAVMPHPNAMQQLRLW